MSKVLMSGNDAVVEGAIRAGLDCYFGYPITPQNEIIGGMAARLPPLGRVFLQSESELAAISMVEGAAAAGKRAMTTSSSPGISLMQEGISYIAGAQVPAVIVNVQRGGPGLGNIGAAQGDYFQATRGGGNGDYRTIVLAPASAQEMLDFTFEAFDLADQYRVPVMVLADGRLGPDDGAGRIARSACAKTSAEALGIDRRRGRAPQLRPLLPPAAARTGRAQSRAAKRSTARSNAAKRVPSCTAQRDAALVFAAYGTCAGFAARPSIACASRDSRRGCFARSRFGRIPSKKLQAAAKEAKRVVVVEMSAGQMIDDVRLASGRSRADRVCRRMGGEAPSVKELVALGRKFLGKKGSPR